MAAPAAAASIRRGHDVKAAEERLSPAEPPLPSVAENAAVVADSQPPMGLAEDGNGAMVVADVQQPSADVQPAALEVAVADGAASETLVSLPQTDVPREAASEAAQRQVFQTQANAEQDSAAPAASAAGQQLQPPEEAIVLSTDASALQGDAGATQVQPPPVPLTMSS